MANPKKNVDMFILYVYKYRNKVMEKDENFVLHTDFVSDNFENKKKGSSSSFIIMDSIKKNWESLDENEKNNIWKYLQVLIKLADRYISQHLQK